MKSKKSGADNGQKLILQNHWSSPRWRDTPRARDRSGSGRVAPLPDRSSYCTSPPVFCDARSIQLSSAWVGYFEVGPALTFEVSATDAVARISVAMSVLNMFESPLGAWRASFVTSPLVSRTMRHSDPRERELAHLRVAFSSRRRVAPQRGVGALFVECCPSSRGCCLIPIQRAAI